MCKVVNFIFFLCKRTSPTFIFLFFFFNDTATTEIYTLSLHDALPIYPILITAQTRSNLSEYPRANHEPGVMGSDRKSTRLNSSHLVISYAVFCLKKKNR